MDKKNAMYFYYLHKSSQQRINSRETLFIFSRQNENDDIRYMAVTVCLLLGLGKYAQFAIIMKFAFDGTTFASEPTVFVRFAPEGRQQTQIGNGPLQRIGV